MNDLSMGQAVVTTRSSEIKGRRPLSLTLRGWRPVRKLLFIVLVIMHRYTKETPPYQTLYIKTWCDTALNGAHASTKWDGSNTDDSDYSFTAIIIVNVSPCTAVRVGKFWIPITFNRFDSHTLSLYSCDFSENIRDGRSIILYCCV